LTPGDVALEFAVGEHGLSLHVIDFGWVECVVKLGWFGSFGAERLGGGCGGKRVGLVDGEDEGRVVDTVLDGVKELFAMGLGSACDIDDPARSGADAVQHVGADAMGKVGSAVTVSHACIESKHHLRGVGAVNDFGAWWGGHAGGSGKKLHGDRGKASIDAEDVEKGESRGRGIQVGVFGENRKWDASKCGWT